MVSSAIIRHPIILPVKQVHSLFSKSNGNRLYILQDFFLSFFPVYSFIILHRLIVCETILSQSSRFQTFANGTKTLDSKVQIKSPAEQIAELIATSHKAGHRDEVQIACTEWHHSEIL